eukprot:594327-Pleurochrysis_carterae.AAC.7
MQRGHGCLTLAAVRLSACSGPALPFGACAQSVCALLRARRAVPIRAGRRCPVASRRYIRVSHGYKELTVPTKASDIFPSGFLQR